MITKIVEIDGRQVTFKASAAVPRFYRIKFRRDIIQDLQKLKKAYVENQTEAKQFEAIDLEVFENVAYIMAKHATPDLVPQSPEEWLDQFNMFSIYTVLPAILELWCLNEESLVESKKKLNEAVGN
jgi:hypothetical protein